MLQREVASGVHRIEDVNTNWYLVEDEDGVTIVDAGVPTSWRSLLAALETIGRRPDEVRAVVLTHAHFDHIGFAERARRELDVPVHVHTNDVPLTRHPRRYSYEGSMVKTLLRHPRGVPIFAGFIRHRALFPPPIATVSRFEDGVLAVPGRPRVLFTPGHTIGHCALHLPDRDVVVSGDAIVTLDPYTGLRGPRLVARAATADSVRGMDVLDVIAQTGATTVLPGHGDPWTGGAAAAVEHARAAGVA
jgi:glyoxylase-like metal-dependent hydrolase (beta-lactamase superfamily II)